MTTSIFRCGLLASFALVHVQPTALLHSHLRHLPRRQPRHNYGSSEVISYKRLTSDLLSGTNIQATTSFVSLENRPLSFASASHHRTSSLKQKWQKRLTAWEMSSPTWWLYRYKSNMNECNGWTLRSNIFNLYIYKDMINNNPREREIYIYYIHIDR